MADKTVGRSEDFAQAAYEAAALDFLVSDRKVATNDLPKTDATVAEAARYQQAVEDAHLKVGPLTQGVRDEHDEAQAELEAEAERQDEIHAERLENLEKAREAKAAKAEADEKPSKADFKAAHDKAADDGEDCI